MCCYKEKYICDCNQNLRCSIKKQTNHAFKTKRGVRELETHRKQLNHVFNNGASHL